MTLKAFSYREKWGNAVIRGKANVKIIIMRGKAKLRMANKLLFGQQLQLSTKEIDTENVKKGFS